MYEFLQSKDFLDNRANKRHYFFKDLGLELPTWDNIFQVLNRTAKQNPKFKITKNLVFSVMIGNQLKQVGEFLQEYAKLDPYKQSSAHLYISLLDDGTYGRHKDRADVIFWQLQGSTHWLVEDTEKAEYVLTPGDAIYIPVGMFHTVNSLSSRAGVSFGLDY